MDDAKDDLVRAVMYALRCGCFFPVPEPPRNATVEQWTKWGAMRNLHNAIANMNPGGARFGLKGNLPVGE